MVRGRHRALLCEDTEAACEGESRREAERMLLSPVMMLATHCSRNNTRWGSSPDCNLFGYFESSANYNCCSSVAPLSPLPAGVKLLSLEAWGEGAVLVRLENTAVAGRGQTVSLAQLLATLGTPARVTETALDGNMALADMKRLRWNVGDEEEVKQQIQSVDIDNIELEPKQIRTFVIKFT